MWSNMSRQRKQTLSIRDYNDLEIVDVSQEFVAVQPTTPVKKMDDNLIIPKTPEHVHDPFMHQSIVDSPIGLSLESSLGVCPGGVVSPLDVSTEELVNSHFTTFMDVLPDEPWDMAGLDPSVDHTGDRIGREMFQDLRHTSTPKGARSSDSFCLDSGIQVSLPSRKRIRFNKDVDNHRKGRVLNDITGNCFPSHKRQDSFINISADSDSSYTDCGSENLVDTESVKRVSIIRRNLVKKSIKSPISSLCFDTSLEIPFERKMSLAVATLQQKKVSYYTGIKDYSTAASLLTRFVVPTEEGMNPSQVILMSLMRLRLNLEWQDLSFRFNTQEDTIIRLFERTLDILATSLGDDIPWSRQFDDRQIQNDSQSRLIYAHPVYFQSESLQKILVCVSAEQVPVLYISKAYPSEQKALDVITSMLGNRLVVDDIVCSRGYAHDDSIVCFKVEKSCPEQIIHLSYKDPANYQNRLRDAMKVVKHLNEFKMFAGKFRASESTMTKIVTVVCAITNINSYVNYNNLTGSHVSDFRQLRL